MMEKRKYFMEKLDQVREVLLTEPRGYPCQNLNIIVPPTDSMAVAGYIIAEQNFIYPLFSGHNTICVVTALLETGLVSMQEETEFNLESPGGLISVRACCAAGRVTEVSLTSLPSFVGRRDVTVTVPSVGQVTLDLVFGGMWFAIVSAEQVGLEIMIRGIHTPQRHITSDFFGRTNNTIAPSNFRLFGRTAPNHNTI